MIELEGRCRHHDGDDLPLGLLVVMKLLLVGLVEQLEEFFAEDFGLLQVEIEVEENADERDL